MGSALPRTILAREGKDVELKARPVTIEEYNVRQARYGYTHSDRAGAELVGAIVAEKASDGWIANIAPHEDMQPVMELDVTVTCSAGTYIRALARDLGEELGLGGHLDDVAAHARRQILSEYAQRHERPR